VNAAHRAAAKFVGTIKAYGAMAGFAVDWQLSGFHVS
jgi:hypothetical protein